MTVSIAGLKNVAQTPSITATAISIQTLSISLYAKNDTATMLIPLIKSAHTMSILRLYLSTIVPANGPSIILGIVTIPMIIPTRAVDPVSFSTKKASAIEYKIGRAHV